MLKYTEKATGAVVEAEAAPDSKKVFVKRADGARTEVETGKFAQEFERAADDAVVAEAPAAVAEAPAEKPKVRGNA